MKYNIVCRELFNAAFVSCWMELRPRHQEDLVLNLKQALSHQNIPEITQTVLNLSEFMEHCEDAIVSHIPLIDAHHATLKHKLQMKAFKTYIYMYKIW